MKSTLFGLIAAFFAISTAGEAQARLSLPKNRRESSSCGN